jgi:transposase
VVIGVDTHLDFHVAVALDPSRQAPRCHYHARHQGGLPPAHRVGRRVRSGGQRRGGRDRQLRGRTSPAPEDRRRASVGGRKAETAHLRRKGKSDPIDAEAAARAVLSGEAAGEPRSGDGRVEMVWAFRERLDAPW